MSEEVRFISMQAVGFSGMNATVLLIGLTADGRVYSKNYTSHPWELMNMRIQEEQP